MKFVSIIFALFLSLNTMAAKVIYIKGNVSCNGKTLKKNDDLKIGSIINVASKSLAILKLDDESTIKINQNSQFLIHNETPKKANTEVRAGSVFIQVLKSLSKESGNKFFVKAKTASMGVRGTAFFVSLGQSETDDVWMCVNTGLVAVKGASDLKATLVKAGEGVQVKGAKKTTAPKPLAWTKKLNWNMDENSGALENDVSIEEAYTDLLNQDYD